MEFALGSMQTRGALQRFHLGTNWNEWCWTREKSSEDVARGKVNTPRVAKAGTSEVTENTSPLCTSPFPISTCFSFLSPQLFFSHPPRTSSLSYQLANLQTQQQTQTKPLSQWIPSRIPPSKWPVMHVPAVALVHDADCSSSYVGDKVNEVTSGASKEANKNVAKDSDASLGTRASAAKDAVGDKVDESSNSVCATSLGAFYLD